MQSNYEVRELTFSVGANSSQTINILDGTVIYAGCNTGGGTSNNSSGAGGHYTYVSYTEHSVTLTNEQTNKSKGTDYWHATKATAVIIPN